MMAAGSQAANSMFFETKVSSVIGFISHRNRLLPPASTSAASAASTSRPRYGLAKVSSRR